jgi:hypothetical protein
MAHEWGIEVLGHIWVLKFWHVSEVFEFGHPWVGFNVLVLEWGFGMI